MIGVSLAGLITFISKAYGGRSSDKLIFHQSNIVERLKRDEGIVVDKGFLIDDICEPFGVQVIGPPFL